MRTDSALNQFLTEYFERERAERYAATVKIEPLPPPSTDLTDAMTFLLNQRELIKKMFTIPLDRLVGTKLRVKLPPATWRKP